MTIKLTVYFVVLLIVYTNSSRLLNHPLEQYFETLFDVQENGLQDAPLSPQTFSLRIQDDNGVDLLATDDIVKKSSFSPNNGRDFRNSDDLFAQEHVQCEMNITMLNLHEEFGSNWVFHGFDWRGSPKIRTAKCQRVPEQNTSRVRVPCKQSVHTQHQHLCYLRGNQCETLRKEVYIWKRHKSGDDEGAGEWIPEKLDIDAGCACHSEFHYR